MAAARPVVLVTGGNGQVGNELKTWLAPLAELVVTDRASLDLGDEAAIRALVRQVKPAVIVNAAAYTAVDKAESETERAFAVNGAAPGILAEEAAALGAWMIHYSTDYVFPGDKPAGAYGEDEPTSPVNAYGRSKLEGEQRVAAAGGRYLILRTSWVYGAHGANFVKTIVRLARERERLTIVADQYGAPTSSHLIADVTAQLLPQLLREPSPAVSGIYHLQGGGDANWHEFAVAIVDTLRGAEPGLRCGEVAPIPSSAYPTPARRPANSRMDCSKLQRTFGLALPHWRDDFASTIGKILGR